jgi:signal transduction histidine kinase
MSLAASPGSLVRIPQRDEMVPLRERAAFLEGVRLTFALMVIAVALLVPVVAETHRLVLVLASVIYLAVAAIPQALARLGRRPMLGLLQASLLLDGLYLAWVMLETGGTASPFRILVYVHIVAVMLAASYRTGLKIAFWHTLLYLLLFEAVRGGFLPASGPPLADGVARGSVAGIVIVFWVSGIWLLAFATAVFSAQNERELRSQKIDLQQLSEWVADVDHLTSAEEIAGALLDRLHLVYGFRREVLLASPKDDLELVGSLGVDHREAFGPGLDRVMEDAWATREVAAVAELDPAEDPRLTSLLPEASNLLVVPMFADRGYRLGFLILEHPQGDQIKTWVVSMVRQFATHAAMALHSTWLLETIQDQLSEIKELKDRVVMQNLSLEAQVAEQTRELRDMVKELQQVDEHRRDLLGHIVTAQEEERERIAGDVHDDPVQRIVALNMRLQLLRRTLEDPDQIEVVDRLLESAHSCIQSMRHLLFELRPPILDEHGLGAALREYLQEKAPDFTYRVEDLLESQPPSQSLIVLYRIAQEALANAYKHAEAANVHVTISEQDGGLLVQIQDDGVGFAGEVPRVSAPGHMGLSSMRERAQLQGGWCEISSLPGNGTTVRFWIPAGESFRTNREEGPEESLKPSAMAS